VVTNTHAQWDIVSSVGLTALAVAAARSIETHRRDPLVQDPFAEDLVQAASPPMPMPTRPITPGGKDPEYERLWTHMADRIGLRTRFFDQFFEQSIQSGVTQAVILGSGLDTRAFRMQWPQGFPVFEIDQPQVVDFKDQVLDDSGTRPRCERHCVRVDLRDDWASALTQAGFDASQPTAWLAEGLLAYLPRDAEQRLLETIHHSSAPGSRVSLDSRSGRRWRDSALVSMMSQYVGVDARTLLHNDERTAPDTTLAALGWTTTRNTITELAELYQRPVTPLGDEHLPDVHFITAHRP
jgi:methyltransferase (TIGR00027 family)